MDGVFTFAGSPSCFQDLSRSSLDWSRLFRSFFSSSPNSTSFFRSLGFHIKVVSASTTSATHSMASLAASPFSIFSLTSLTAFFSGSVFGGSGSVPGSWNARTTLSPTTHSLRKQMKSVVYALIRFFFSSASMPFSSTPKSLSQRCCSFVKTSSMNLKSFFERPSARIATASISSKGWKSNSNGSSGL